MTQPIILITNDDGYGAAGIEALAAAAQELGEVWVVAPATEQSGVSSKISLHEPVRLIQHGERRFAVTGSPADCAYIALTHMLDERPAIVLSGINHGANLGDDVMYSGTVAAALEATLNDVPAIAVSLAAFGRDLDYSGAAAIAVEYAHKVIDKGLPRDTLLNINVPRGGTVDSPRLVTKLGRRNYLREVSEKRDPRGKPYYWIGGAEIDFDDLPGSDCNAISAGNVSITPVQADMTRYKFIDELASW